MSPVGGNCTISMSRRRPPRAGRARCRGRLVGEQADDCTCGGRAIAAGWRRLRTTRSSRAGCEEEATTPTCPPSVAQRDRARLLEIRIDGRPPATLLGSRLMISMPVRSPLWMCGSWVWPAKRILVDAAVRMPVGRSSRSDASARARGRAPPLTSVTPAPVIVIHAAGRVSSRCASAGVRGPSTRCRHPGPCGCSRRGRQALHRHRDCQVRRVAARCRAAQTRRQPAQDDEAVSVQSGTRGGHGWGGPEVY